MDAAQLRRAAGIIQSGGLVAFPTETVYGLGANALDPLAVAQIFALKQRPHFDPLIVHIADIKDLARLTDTPPHLRPAAELLTAKFWPGPLTIVLPKKQIVPDIVTAGLPTVGLRMPDNTIALELIRQSGCPLAAPSANKFGQLSPTTAAHVRKQLPDLECILDGGPAEKGLESTVIALQPDGFVILRQGVITAQELAAVLPASSRPIANAGLASPGLLQAHYSPNKPIYLLGGQTPRITKDRTGYLAMQKAPPGYALTEILSAKGDLREAAANLFGALHRLEEAPDIECILAEPAPAEGIGLAILDKLRKACFRWQSTSPF
ncbi:MAG: threonylcarbamoyl-AMP synthase [Candidatus Margulisbacteria bacterium]|jgi:L-threonylcarbamoyladenylate synthase|nr:threonylcarbamoyl-AMP synthase [Candidatus Margulisiibacteriota bacterium]